MRHPCTSPECSHLIYAPDTVLSLLSICLVVCDFPRLTEMIAGHQTGVCHLHSQFLCDVLTKAVPWASVRVRGDREMVTVQRTPSFRQTKKTVLFWGPTQAERPLSHTRCGAPQPALPHWSALLPALHQELLVPWPRTGMGRQAARHRIRKAETRRAFVAKGHGILSAERGDHECPIVS